MFTSVVWPNGTLNQKAIYRKEEIYQGMNGRFVERFFMNSRESYIFKPLTNSSQIGKEVWIHNHLLAKLPPIFPKIMAYSIDEHTDNNWIIFEDLGKISHRFNEDIAYKVIDLMANWHSIPVENFMSEPLKGPKPFIEEMVQHLFILKQKLQDISVQYGIAEKMLDTIFSMLENHRFSNKKVLSHGDLHQGNYGQTGKRVVIIDWEHAHINSPYWDLYHFLDISHPDFPKGMNKGLRNLLLEHYFIKTNLPQEEKFSFKQEYFLFSSAFSLWMMLLIQGDLERNASKWPKTQLIGQMSETITNLIQCGEELKQDLISDKWRFYYDKSWTRYEENPIYRGTRPSRLRGPS
ncbi:aminoglycoside phosphotransferase family protein [Bacillus sp. S/N-304-OC-R1]|uniref:aminoglycoside phosphotransferase family protein n=1 Tax=Bacillus sp. S/N-304-OC-R1 TaxID=2758034 RepID=UPI001C8DB4B2|nr:aminoglycoside phosphotransferase family protein [Bacillus sp. S/N-304-OC-R1]MBY0121442.1 phosphotransferase [Bacillus sp. S/N-304-OC-R1]